MLLIVILISNTSTCFGLTYLTDIKYTDWYFDDIVSLQHKNIIDGYEDKTFKPNNSISKAEALKLIIPISNARILRSNEKEWYSDYLHTALINNFCSENFRNNINEPITRFEVAELIVKSMKWDNLEYSENNFSDTNNKYANILFDKKIIYGNNENNKTYYYGDKSLTRAEVSAIVKRIFKEIKKEYFPYVNYDLLPKPTKFNSSPMTEEDFLDLFQYMIFNDTFKVELTYKNKFKTKEEAENHLSKINNAFTIHNFASLESAGFFSSISSNGSFETEGNNTTLKLTVEIYLKDEFKNKKISDYIYRTVFEAINTFYTLREENKIKMNSTQTEKAKAYFEWIGKNTGYDDINESHMKYIPYSVFVNKSGVCQAYTGAYNMLLNLEGIKTGTDTIPNHIWTTATLDGKFVHIDSTNGDGRISNEPRWEFFDTTKEFIEEKFSQQ